MVLPFFLLNKHGELTKLMAGEICSPWERSTHCRGRWMEGDEVMTSALKRKIGTAECSSIGKAKIKNKQPPNFRVLKERDAE